MARGKSAGRNLPRTVAHRAGLEGHVVQMECEAAYASLLNAKTALWSGGRAILSALMAIWAALGPLL